MTISLGLGIISNYLRLNKRSLVQTPLEELIETDEQVPAKPDVELSLSLALQQEELFKQSRGDKKDNDKKDNDRKEFNSLSADKPSKEEVLDLLQDACEGLLAELIK